MNSKTGSSQSADANALLISAAHDGLLSAQSMAVLQVNDLSAEMNAALGTPALDVTASEVVLMALLIDDSGSIRYVSGNTEAVRDGHNLVIDSLRASKQDDGIQVLCTYLNGTILYPFSPLTGAQQMTKSNYDPNGSTPLFDQSVVMLARLAAKTQEFKDNGVPVRGIALIVTDGADAGSRKNNAKDVAKIVKDLLKTETFIVAGMGIDDGSTDFRAVFKEMGIPDEWVLTPKNSPSEIRKAFSVFSKSAVRASQTAASFSKTAAGGFGTN
jgi:hypothetical protein